MPVNKTFRAKAYMPPGTLIRVVQLPQKMWPAHTAAAHRVSYHSTGRTGRPRLVTGAVYIPEGNAPRGGWPVVSYAHGTTGISHACAPSLTGLFLPERGHVAHWLERGFAVTATDYEGLGGRGNHPYFDGKHEAWDIIDIVRAARQLDHPIGCHWVVTGFSQGGHAALFTAQMASGYAPDLDFRACVALAPPSHMRKLWTSMAAFDHHEVSPLLPYILEGLASTHPHLHPDELLTAKGRDLVHAAHSEGLLAMFRDCMDIGTDEVEATALTTDEQILAALDDDEIPMTRFDRPVYIGQGLADEIATPDATADLVSEIKETQADLTYHTFDGVSHTQVLTAAHPASADWVHQVFGRRPR